MLKYTPTKARAQASSFGFQKSQARPQATSGQAQGLAWPGLWPQAGASTSLECVGEGKVLGPVHIYPRPERNQTEPQKTAEDWCF
jgi:hypothetical protein